MPLAAMFLGTAFVGLVEFLVKWFTKKVAVTVAAVTAFVTLTTAMLAVVAGAMDAVQVALPSFPGMQTALWVAVPDNLLPTIAIVYSADTAISLYRWNVTTLKLVTQG